MSLKKKWYVHPNAGTPGKRFQPPMPIVIRWCVLFGLTSAMYVLAQALKPSIPPTDAQYTSLSTSGSFHTSHIAICDSLSYRSMIARTTSTWCA